jgi:hypothetical protein
VVIKKDEKKQARIAVLRVLVAVYIYSSLYAARGGHSAGIGWTWLSARPERQPDSIPGGCLFSIDDTQACGDCG